MLRFEEEYLTGLYTIYPTVFKDDRGYFFESYSAEKYAAICNNLSFVQDNLSKSAKGILRGLHFQAPPHAQGKLVQVLQGAVLDVAVDIRKSSDTYGCVFQQILSAENALQMYIPAGFAHGFYTLEDDTIFSYKCTAAYQKAAERCLRWDDPTLAINWGQDVNPILSKKDALGEAFKAFETPFQ